MPVGGPHMSSVRKAREALKERAHETYEMLLGIIKDAQAEGNYEVAAKYTWMLLEHTPAEEGQTVIDQSASKPKESSDRSGPSINIGFALGGIAPPQQLSPAASVAPVIDVVPESTTEIIPDSDEN